MLTPKQFFFYIKTFYARTPGAQSNSTGNNATISSFHYIYTIEKRETMLPNRDHIPCTADRYIYLKMRHNSLQSEQLQSEKEQHAARDFSSAFLLTFFTVRASGVLK
jgi:hypothetical protein